MNNIEQILLEMKEEIAKQAVQIEQISILLLGDYNEDIEGNRESRKGIVVEAKE